MRTRTGGRRGEREPPAIAARERELDAGEERIDARARGLPRPRSRTARDPILRLQAGEDVVAETGLAHGSRERRGADDPDSCSAHAGHDRGERERQLHLDQRLHRRHADTDGRLLDRSVDAEHAGDRVPEDRQHRVERQRQQRRQEPERRELEAERRRGEQRETEQHRIEQREQREAGDGLRESDDAQKDHAEARRAHAGDRERKTEQELRARWR